MVFRDLRGPKMLKMSINSEQYKVQASFQQCGSLDRDQTSSAGLPVQGPHGIHVDEPKKQARGEKRTLPTGRQQTSAKLRYQSKFPAQGCAFVARLCCLSHTTTLPKAREDLQGPYLCFLTAVPVRENQVLHNH